MQKRVRVVLPATALGMHPYRLFTQWRRNLHVKVHWRYFTQYSSNLDAHGRAVVIYTDRMLAPSETFIRSQAQALTRFTPVYAGARAYGPGGLELPRERLMTINKSGSRLGRIWEIPHKAFGYDPLFLHRIRRWNPVLIHAHFGPSGVLILPVARKLHVPLIVTFHGIDATCSDDHMPTQRYSLRPYLRVRPQLQREARLFIAVSEFIKGEMLKKGFPEEKIIVHYIGVDTEYFRPAPNVQRDKIVLFIGRLIEKKGCECLIRAMKDVQSVVSDARLVVIGDGPLGFNLQSMARGTLSGFEFLGWKPPAAVRNWIRKAAVLAVPSVRTQHGDAEGLPTVIGEAQAMGLPVAGFDSAGIPEAIAHGETGLLTAEGDCEGLARNILLLLQHEALWHRMSAAARQRAVGKFDMKSQARKLEQIYESVLTTGSKEVATI